MSFAQIDCALLRSPRWLCLSANARLSYISMIAAAVEEGAGELPLCHWNNSGALEYLLGLESCDADHVLRELSDPKCALVTVTSGSIRLHGFTERYSTMLRERIRNAQRQQRYRDKERALSSPQDVALRNADVPCDVTVQSIVDDSRLEKDVNGSCAVAANSPATPPGASSPARSRATIIPADLTGLPLFSENARLCKTWEDLHASWKHDCPSVDLTVEVQKAHAFAVRKKAEGKPYRNIVRYLGSWIIRAQDNAAKYSRLKPEKQGSLPIIRAPEPPANG